MADAPTPPSAAQNVLPGASVLGTGMAGMAEKILKSRGYQLAVQEAQAQGLPPPTPQQYMQSMKQ